MCVSLCVCVQAHMVLCVCVCDCEHDCMSLYVFLSVYVCSGC